MQNQTQSPKWHTGQRVNVAGRDAVGTIITIGDEWNRPSCQGKLLICFGVEDGGNGYSFWYKVDKVTAITPAPEEDEPLQPQADPNAPNYCDYCEANTGVLIRETPMVFTLEDGTEQATTDQYYECENYLSGWFVTEYPDNATYIEPAPIESVTSAPAPAPQDQIESVTDEPARRARTTCPVCGSEDVNLQGVDDGGGDYGDSVCDQYHCWNCDSDFEDCWGISESYEPLPPSEETLAPGESLTGIDLDDIPFDHGYGGGGGYDAHPLAYLGREAFAHPTVKAAVARFQKKSVTTDFLKRTGDHVVIDGYKSPDWAAWRVQYAPEKLKACFAHWTWEEVATAYGDLCDHNPPYPEGMTGRNSVIWETRNDPVLHAAWQVWEVETQLISAELNRRVKAGERTGRKADSAHYENLGRGGGGDPAWRYTDCECDRCGGMGGYDDENYNWNTCEVCHGDGYIDCGGGGGYDKAVPTDAEQVRLDAAMNCLVRMPSSLLPLQDQQLLIEIGGYLMARTEDNKARALAAVDRFFEAWAAELDQELPTIGGDLLSDEIDTPTFGMPVYTAGGGGVRDEDDDYPDPYQDGWYHCEVCGEILNAFGQCMNIFCDAYVKDCETHHRARRGGGGGVHDARRKRIEQISGGLALTMVFTVCILIFAFSLFAILFASGGGSYVTSWLYFFVAEIMATAGYFFYSLIKRLAAPLGGGGGGEYAPVDRCPNCGAVVTDPVCPWCDWNADTEEFEEIDPKSGAIMRDVIALERWVRTQRIKTALLLIATAEMAFILVILCGVAAASVVGIFSGYGIGGENLDLLKVTLGGLAIGAISRWFAEVTFGKFEELGGGGGGGEYRPRRNIRAVWVRTPRVNETEIAQDVQQLVEAGLLEPIIWGDPDQVSYVITPAGMDYLQMEDI